MLKNRKKNTILFPIFSVFSWNFYMPNINLRCAWWIIIIFLSFPAVSPVVRNCRVIWKDFLWFLPSSQISGRMYKTRPLFQLSVWCEKCVAARHYAVICKQLLISNDRSMVRWVVLGLSEDEACTDLLENLCVNSLKGGLSNAITFNPPSFLIGQYL
jgi:hypothetical protein